jgi:hypothetical protein
MASASSTSPPRSCSAASAWTRPRSTSPPPADVLTGQTGELRFANLSGPGAPPSVQPIQVVSDAGMTVETRDHQTQLTAIRSGATAAGLLLALGTSP